MERYKLRFARGEFRLPWCLDRELHGLRDSMGDLLPPRYTHRAAMSYTEWVKFLTGHDITTH